MITDISDTSPEREFVIGFYDRNAHPPHLQIIVGAETSMSGKVKSFTPYQAIF